MGPRELAGVVSQALEDAGITAVLSGGGAISIYTENAYESSDLDYVTSEPLAALSSALAPLGFRHGAGRSFEHPDTDLYLEFPPGPLAAGALVFEEWEQLETEYGCIQIMSPTQMVLDRLAAFIHWNDQPSLDQAVAVATSRSVDLEAVERWIKAERGQDQYQVFQRALHRTRKT